jgi:hypothetical protein
VLGRFPGQHDIAAKGHGAEPVFRHSGTEAGDLGPEAQRKGLDPDAEHAGHQEMPKLVEENQSAQNEHNGDDTHRNSLHIAGVGRLSLSR